MGSLHSYSATPISTSDEDLIRYARTGSERAAEQLLVRYRPLVESKARSYFLLGADHDDVVQEGMIGLFKAIRDFRDGRAARFRAFADLCVTRQIISAVKSATRQKQMPLNGSLTLEGSADAADSMALIDCLPDPRAPDPQECVLRRGETAGRLAALRADLSELEAQVLDRYIAGESYREISDHLECCVKAVDNALQRIKRKVIEHGAHSN